MSWFSKLKDGLKNTSEKISDGIASIVTKKKLDQDTLDRLEELLIMSDLGIESSQKIIKDLSKSKFDQEVDDHTIKTEMSKIIASQIEKAAGELTYTKSKPHVVMMCGVNGNGKTTTIGKLAAKLQKEGKKVTIAACDTFRAAAVEQLKIWATRAKAEFVCGKENADPASVAYRSLATAQKNGSDILFLDTAGRLANKDHLMQELAKIVKVLKKLDADAPHDRVLVLDATTGQNALLQVESFKNIVDLNGLVITKLDGSAKAGIVVAISQKFDIPITHIGVGESIEDLDQFTPKEFADNLVGLKK